MLYRLIKSAIFGVMMTLVMLIAHGFKAAGAISIWAEAGIRFVLYVIVYFLITLVIDYIKAKKIKGHHEA